MVLYTESNSNSTDWTKALLDLDINIPSGDSQISILCPFHHDTSESCSINLDKGLWICFAGCGQGTLKNFIKEYKDWEYYQVADYLSRYNSTITDDLFKLDDDIDDTVLPEIDIPYKLGAVPQWIFNREFTKSSMRKWGCGVTVRNGLVIPMVDQDERAVGWAIRQEHQIPKYLYSKGFKKSHILFGQHLVKPSEMVCVTEGPLDAMWLSQLGFNAVSILGAIVSKRQIELLLSLPTKEIVVCLDNDEAGQRASDRLSDGLRNKTVLSYIEIPSEYKDVQDVRSYDILNNIINNRQYW